MAPQFDSPPSPNSFSKPKPRPPKSPAQVAHIRVRNRRREYLERNPDYLKSAEHEFAGKLTVILFVSAVMVSLHFHISLTLCPDPLLYDSLVRHFFTQRERQAESQEKGYSRTLETSLLRGEARLAELASNQDGADDDGRVGANNSQSLPRAAAVPTAPTAVAVATGFEIDVAMAAPAATKEEGRERWEEFLRDRFVRGGDEEFEYRAVDEDDDLDVLERKDREDAWFDDESPDWATTPGAEGDDQKQRDGEEDEEKGRPERILLGETGIQDF